MWRRGQEIVLLRSSVTASDNLAFTPPMESKYLMCFLAAIAVQNSNYNAVIKRAARAASKQAPC